MVTKLEGCIDFIEQSGNAAQRSSYRIINENFIEYNKIRFQPWIPVFTGNGVLNRATEIFFPLS